MQKTEYLFSGFGGQGILFAGKFIVNKGLIEDKNVSWLPSYGPEMRGGTASCGVIVADDFIGSPIVSAPDVLVAMNLPSLEKYEKAVKKGGIIVFDSTLAERDATRQDVRAFAIPATKIASDNGIPTLANMIAVGKVLKVTGEYDEQAIARTLKKIISARHADMFELNLKALKIGAEL